MKPSAKIIADSISPEGVRLTTMEVTMHRFVLAEFNTHRVFSRNSASSRAIPVAKQVERITEDLAYPVSWPAEQSGMQGGAELDPYDVAQAQSNWAKASGQAVQAVGAMLSLGENGDQRLHKSVVNRLLEPFMWHTVIVTATAWENFFALRLDADAQPEIRQAALAMKVAYDESTPELLLDGAWHLPYIDGETIVETGGLNDRLVKISSARCARVSFLTHDGKRDVSADLALYDRLVTNRLDKGLAIHWSPLEHVATPWGSNRQSLGIDFEDLDGTWRDVSTDHLPIVGNLLGWRSLRTTVEATHHERTYR